jgi:hypothetical protein
MTVVGFNQCNFIQLDENRARPYSRAHDQRRDHCHRSPPPQLCGTGGRLRLRFQPLPPDPVRGIFLSKQRDLIRRLPEQAGDRHVYPTRL